MANALKYIKNVSQALWPTVPQVVNDPKDLSKSLSPVQIQRIKQDIASWRANLNEAELPWYPQRVRLQQMYNDTVLNAHVQACMQKRKNLTLLKGFHICDQKGVKDEALTDMLNKKWMYDLISYALDAKFFGYSLINFGPVVNSEFPELGIVRRANVSPDRQNVASYPYSISGAQFLEDPYYNWHLWVSTVTEIGAQVQNHSCGYGLLYPVAYYEIFLRNLTGNNGDYVEVFGQPLKHAKTSKRDGSERDYLEQALQNMAGNSYIITDPMDEIEFKDGSTGKGNEIFANFEERLEKKISKLLLGHADALDSVAGKLGAEDAAMSSLEQIQIADCRDLEHIINSELFPRLRNIGFFIPEDRYFKTENNKEKQEQRYHEEQSNKAVLDNVKILKDIGIDVDKKWLVEMTGIKFANNNTEGEIVDKPDVESDAKAQLRGSIGGVQGILQLQASVSLGTTNYDAAISILKIIYGYNDQDSIEILGKPKAAIPSNTGITNKNRIKLDGLYK